VCAAIKPCSATLTLSKRISPISYKEYSQQAHMINKQWENHVCIISKEIEREDWKQEIEYL
jgi:hypothetical protein